MKSKIEVPNEADLQAPCAKSRVFSQQLEQIIAISNKGNNDLTQSESKSMNLTLANSLKASNPAHDDHS